MAAFEWSGVVLCTRSGSILRMEERPCRVCGTDVLGRDFVRMSEVEFVLAGDRDDPEMYASNDEREDVAEYFCRGCIGNFEEAMWMRIDRERTNA